jgi:O-acetylhomoserine (thiol)-lyase
MSYDWNFETKSIHTGFDRDEKTGATSLPIYETAAYAYDTAEDLADVFQGRKFGHIYSRISNPTITALEQRITALENGRGAIATASGMAAIMTVILALVKPGEEIISSQSLFGGTIQLFHDVIQNYDIKIVYVQSTDVAAYGGAITAKTRLIFLETIGNPKLDVPDIGGIAKVANEKNVPLVVDGTLTTPYLFAAKQFGVSIVIHSTSKYITGNGSTIGGVLVDLGNYDWGNSLSEPVREMARKAGDFAFLARTRKQILQNTGGCLSPFNAYLQNLGLETLALRMEKHCGNALALAQYLENHPVVTVVNYPGLAVNPDHQVAKNQFGKRYGGLLTLRLKSFQRCFDFIRHLKIVKNIANLGDTKTLIIHPASTIYAACSEAEQSAAGVYPDLLRVSVGIENINDIISDFEQALTEVARI